MKNTKKSKVETKLQKCRGDLCGHINICYKRSPNDLFVCTRSVGHKGNHVACDGGNIHNLAVWKKAAKDEKVENMPPIDDILVDASVDTDFEESPD